jgi:acyl-CoA reductase-like NAD-dependent aldehyde dehydrogenase
VRGTSFHDRQLDAGGRRSARGRAGRPERAAHARDGQTLIAAKAEVVKCAKACRFYAEHAERFLADEPADAVTADRAYACYQPLGPVLAVTRWNFPLWQAMRFAAPALMAGNTATPVWSTG